MKLQPVVFCDRGHEAAFLGQDDKPPQAPPRCSWCQRNTRRCRNPVRGMIASRDALPLAIAATIRSALEDETVPSCTDDDKPAAHDHEGEPCCGDHAECLDEDLEVQG